MSIVLKQRYNAPSATDKRWIHYSKGGYATACIIDSKTGSVNPNCVGYNNGRVLEALGNTAPNWKIPVCNAEDCYEQAKKNGLQVGQTPKLGASIVWRAGNLHNGSDGCGHIAFIEEIMDNGDLVYTEGAYQSYTFQRKVVTKASGYMYSKDRPLVGFIYYADFVPEKKEEKKSEDTTTNTPSISATTFQHTIIKGESYWKYAELCYGNGSRYPEIQKLNNNKGLITGQKVTLPVTDLAKKNFPTECKVDATQTTTTKTPSASIKPYKGCKVTLTNAPVYSQEGSSASIGVRTGVYYLWDGVQCKGNRYKVTNRTDRCGVAHQISFFVDLDDSGVKLG